MVAGLASRLAGVPLVHHIHSPTDHDSTHPWQDRMNAWAERFGPRQASALIAVSASLGQYVRRQGYAADQVVVIPNGVPRAAPIPARDATDTTWTLGMIAWFRPRKGIEVLLHALALLRWQGLASASAPWATLKCPVCPQGPATCLGLGLEAAIDWIGFQRDIDRRLAQMDLMVLPSLFGEGLPMVLLGGDVGRLAGGGRRRGRHSRGRPRRPRRPAGPAGRPRGTGRVIGRVVGGQLAWPALRAACLARHAERSRKSAWPPTLPPFTAACWPAEIRVVPVSPGLSTCGTGSASASAVSSSTIESSGPKNWRSQWHPQSQWQRAKLFAGPDLIGWGGSWFGEVRRPITLALPAANL